MKHYSVLVLDLETQHVWIQVWKHENKYRICLKSESENGEWNYTLTDEYFLWQKLNFLTNEYLGIKNTELQIDKMYHQYKQERGEN